ncbi:putative glycoside hydrolase [bacterium]|nr:putative glycoside hydrolase [bacterium]
MRLFVRFLLFVFVILVSTVLSCLFLFVRKTSDYDLEKEIAISYNNTSSSDPSVLQGDIVNIFQPEENRKENRVFRVHRFHPSIIKAVYLTSWAAGRKDYIDYILSLAESTEINAVVIDIKDYSGYLAYKSQVAEVEKYKAQGLRIKDIDSLIKKFHQKGIYVIARIVVFQDPVLARARPDLAVHSKAKITALANNQYSTSTSTSTSTSFRVATLWSDNKGLFWVDPASKEVWQYNVAIAKEAFSKGFDEVNFDYVRFPSDGDLKDMEFPFWDKSISKREVIRKFFQYLHKELEGQIISVDLFGLSCTREDDLGIGQVIEDVFSYVDYVCPMVYPSHYETGFLGYQEPARHPYEVVNYSLKKALTRLKKHNPAEERKTKIRPWLQDFDLGGVAYSTKEVKEQIKAVYQALGSDFSGFMIWSPSNFYTKEAFGERSYIRATLSLL